MNVSTRANHKRRREEAEALGDPEKIGFATPTPDSGRWVNGRFIQPGTRPYLKKVDQAWPLTARQRKTGRIRTARSWGRMLKMLDAGQMTMAEFVETLSPEELAQGQLKDKDGRFKGQPPAWVPREFHRACIKELMRRGRFLWQSNYLEAIEVMTQVATDKRVKPADRLKAAQFIIERMEGKIPERVEVTVEDPWQLIIEDIVAEVPESTLLRATAARTAALTAQDEQEAIDAELVEEVPVAPPRRRRAGRRPRA